MKTRAKSRRFQKKRKTCPANLFRARRQPQQQQGSEQSSSSLPVTRAADDVVNSSSLKILQTRH